MPDQRGGKRRLRGPAETLRIRHKPLYLLKYHMPSENLACILLQVQCRGRTSVRTSTGITDVNHT
jgi:hypothetical protein